MKICSTAVLILLVAVIGSAASLREVQNKTVVIESLRRAFIREFSGEFRFIKGELKPHVVDSEKQIFWLAHIKPKRSGYFTVRYSYQYADKFYAEGEHEMRIAVGGKSCTRYPKVVREIGYFCLNDTIIVPIRLDKRSKHVFRLESKYAPPADIEESRQSYNFFLDRLTREEIENPLEPNLKYLGKYRTEELYRNGGGNFTHHAVFQAAAAGKFNLVLSANSGISKDGAIRVFPAVPILVVNAGTAVASLVPEEKITYYTKKRAYSSDYKNNFESNFIILQPGDVFSEAFLAYAEKPWYFDKPKTGEPKPATRNPNPSPHIRRQPFSLPRDVGYNRWIIDYLPD